VIPLALRSASATISKVSPGRSPRVKEGGMPKTPKPRPDFDAMLAVLERASPGYGTRLAREATDWPRQGAPTMTRLRWRVAEDYDALPAHQRPASQEASQAKGGPAHAG
jgi:hypothetical protein